MDEFLILLQAKLDEAKSKGNIDANIENLQGKINKLKIQAELDPKIVQKLADDIGKLSNQKIIISNLGIDAKSASKSGQEYGAQFRQGMSQELSKSEKAIGRFSNSLKSAGRSSTEIDSLVEKVKKLNVQIDSLRFNESTNGIMNIDVSGLDEFGNKVKITQSLVQDLQTMKWNVSSTNTSILSTKEIDKINNAFANFTQKFEQFKSTNSSKLSGLSDPLSNFASVLSGLKSGTSTIDEVNNAFKILQAEASKIDAPLKRQLSTFDSYKNAIDKGKESISGYRAELKGLANTPKELSQELTKASKLLLQINRTEATEGTTANWSNQAREFVDLLESIKNKILVIKKEQSANTSSSVMSKADVDNLLHVQKILNTVSATEKKVRGMLSKQGFTNIKINGIEDTNGKVEKLTITANAASGALEKFDMVRQKVQGGGQGQKVQDWLVQSGDVQVIKSAITAQEELAISVKTTSENFATLKTKWEEQGVLVGEFRSKVEQMESSLASVGSKGELDNFTNKIKLLENEGSTIAKANRIQLSMDTGGYESKVESLIARTMQWTDANGNARISTNELSKAFRQLTEASNNYVNSPTEAHQKALIASEKELDKQIKTVTNSVRSMNAELAKDSAISSFRNQVTDFMSKNGKTVKSFQFGSELKDIFSKIQQGAKLSNQELDVLKQRFIDVQNAARASGKLGKTFFQTLREGMSSFSYWTSSTFLVMKSIQKIKESVNFAKELNSALVNINYTMDVTASQLANIGNKSIDMAKDLHTSAENVLGAVKLYANAKETADSILAKAQPAIMLSNVTGFSGEESAKYLQTIMNQFDLTQDDLMDISDTIQGISQSMAHDFADGIVQINEGIATSGEIARAAGMELADYASMIGLLVEKTGLGGSQLGNSLKTIITRTTKAGKIMGIDEGEISAAETSLRSIGVEVRKTDGEFNAFNDTMSELAKHWDSLSDVEKSNISFNLAGTRQINVIQTLLRNWNEYEDLVNEANSSTGVTFENQEKYAASLEGKLKELSATTTSIGDNIFKSDDLSVIVNGLTKIAGLFDTITSKTKLLGTIGLGAGIFAGWKNVGGDKMYSLIY